MTGMVHEFPQQRAAEQVASEAPPLPIEHHIVAAALKAERLRATADQILLLLQHMPRDAATFAKLHDEMLAAWCDLDTHYGAYRAVLECKGQA